MKKLKALIAGLTALCMCAVYMPLTETILPESAVLSAHAETSGTCGENLTWTLDDEGTLTISGTGEMPSWDNAGNYPWYQNVKNIKKIIFKGSITNIGDYAFAGFNISDITIPASVKNIGIFAFNGCRNLTSITIQDGVSKIGKCAFLGCISLPSVTIPDSVTDITYNAFLYCPSLTSISVSKGNKNYASEDGILFNKDKTELIQYPIGTSRKE